MKRAHRIAAMTAGLAAAIVATGVGPTVVDAFDDGWESAPLAGVALSADRDTMWVVPTDYHSDSCFEHRVEIDRSAARWSVHLDVRRVEEFCTMEGCVASIDDIVVPDEPVNGAVPCGNPELQVTFDPPVPNDVVLFVTSSR